MENRDEYLRAKQQSKGDTDLIAQFVFQILRSKDDAPKAIAALSKIVKEKADFDDQDIIQAIVSTSRWARKDLREASEKLTEELKKTRQEARVGIQVGSGTISAIDRLKTAFIDAIGVLRKEVASKREEPIEVNVSIPEIKLPKIQVPEIKVPEIKLPEIIIPESTVHVEIPDKMTVDIPNKPKWFPEFDLSKVIDAIREIGKSSGSGSLNLPLDEQGRVKVAVDRVGGAGFFGKSGGDATEATLQSILSAISEVAANTDQLEITADSVNLNTDTLEAKTQEVSDRIGEVDASPTSNTLQDRLKGIRTVLDAISSAVDGLEANTAALTTPADTQPVSVESLPAGLATSEKQDSIVSNQVLLQALVQQMADLTAGIERATKHGMIQIALPYAKDTSDQLRVSGTLTMVPQWGSYNSQPVPYSTGSPAGSDTRDMEREFSEIVMELRRQKWVIT